ncbi:MAG: beta-lactamase family protein [Proteobacteria bacterium]|nr:beta-lactamase family protein [Pseudomonadota bacterium]
MTIRPRKMPLSVCFALACAFAVPAGWADTPAAALPTAQVDSAVNAILARTGIPSASIALVRDHAIVYAQAYGCAQLDPCRRATPAMRYAIGSISKEFTATALLLLQEQGKLAIDDTAGKWVVGLPASNASIRSLLSHTSGVRDYWPQDYDPPEMLKPIAPKNIILRWASQPLDFPTGTAWQYSNTGYTIAGLIAEKAAGKPLFEFMREHIFEPLAMQTVYDFDAAPLPPDDAVGYMRYGLGPLRASAKEGRGWLFAAGQLAMTASDLARWDISLIDQRVLNAAGYRDLTGEIRLANGAGSQYALGLDVKLRSGQRELSHGGEVGGFTATNVILPEQGLAVVVLTNQDATGASGQIAESLEKILLAQALPVDATALTEAQRIFGELQNGKIDAARLTSNAKSYFTAQALADFRAGLAPLGKPKSFEAAGYQLRGGLVTRRYKAGFAHKDLNIVVRSTPEGLIEQYTLSAE